MVVDPSVFRVPVFLRAVEFMGKFCHIIDVINFHI